MGMLIRLIPVEWSNEDDKTSSLDIKGGDPKAVDQRLLVYAFSTLDITRARNPTNNNAAMTSATTNPNTLDGAMPTKVFVKLLATATAGLLKKVDDVNQ
jgi:hypothetical protein